MTEATRAIVDYAEDGNATEMRDALYSAIQDRVMSHIEAHKQELAKNLLSKPEGAEVEDIAV